MPIIDIVEPTEFDFSNVTGGNEVTLVVGQWIPVVHYAEGTLRVRAHALDVQGTGSKLKVQVVADGHTRQDPVTRFWDVSGFLAQVVMDDTDTAPFFEQASLATNAGAMVAVAVSGEQPVGGGETITGTLSIDLVLKE